MLRSQQDTEFMRRRVLAAARVLLGRPRRLSVVFEHGHWWAQVDKDDGFTCYDVVDATGPNTYDGFGLEQI